MKTLLFFCLFFSLTAFPASIYVCDSPRTKPGGNTCDYVSLQIQTALDNAADGDTIFLQEGVTYRDVVIRRTHAVPVTVTSMKSDWLPCADCRITPSYLPLLPVFSPGASNYNAPALAGALNGSGGAPAGWRFIGIAFWAGAGRGGNTTYQAYSGALIHTGGQLWDAFQFDGSNSTASTPGPSATITVTGPHAVSNYDIGKTLRISGGASFIPGSYVVQSVSGSNWTLDRPVSTASASGMAGDAGWLIENAVNQPNNIVLDRIFTRDDYDDAVSWQNAVRLNGYNLTLKNSFIWPVFCRGVECHASSIATASNLGPITYTNNFMSAGSIPLFAGGTDADYLGGIQPDVIGRYNYFHRPLKWWSSVNNPQRTYFLANGAKTVCTKNLGEFKSLYRGLLEYNVHENVWADQFCFGQYFAFTNSVRQTTWYSPARGGVWGASLRMNTISANGFSFSITQGDSGWLVITPGQAVCPIISNVFHCRTVASFDPATHSGTVTPAFSASTTNNPEWLYASDPTPGVIDLTIQNSVFRNVGSGPSMLMRDMAVLDSGNVGRVIRSTVRNNLFHTTLNMQNDYGLLVATQETNSVNSSAIGGGPLTYENNTYSYANRSAKSIYWNSNDSSPVARIQGLSLRSNIFPQASDDGSGNIYALGVSGIGFNNWCNIESVAGAPVTLKNNYLYHPSGVSASGCTHASVSGNIASGAPQYIAGTFKIAPGTVLSKAGHDGTDSGVRYDSLPLIRNLRVSPGAHAALLEFDLSAPVADAGARQPCVLEVSADSNLESYLGSYSVIPDLNPSFFKQPDHSARVNPLLLPVVVTDGHVAWPLGDARTTTGDDGLPHNLALTPGTQYYGRLQCYGDSRAFRFTTKSELSGGGSRTMQFAPLPSSATVRVDYGSTPEAGNSMSVAVDGLGRAAVDIPVTAGRYVYFRYAYQTVQGNELYRSGLKLSLP